MVKKKESTSPQNKVGQALANDLGELYQVVGSLADGAGVFETKEVMRALDRICDLTDAAEKGFAYLHEYYEKRHRSLLPFVPKTPLPKRKKK